MPEPVEKTFQVTIRVTAEMYGPAAAEDVAATVKADLFRANPSRFSNPARSVRVTVSTATAVEVP